MIRIGFGAHYTTITTRNPKNSIGSYLGPCGKPKPTSSTPAIGLNYYAVRLEIPSGCLIT